MYSGTFGPRIVLPPAPPSPPARLFDLVLCEPTPLPRPQRCVPKLPDATPDQPLHRVADPLEHLPHLVGLPLAHHHPPPRVHPRGGRAHQFEGVRDHPLSLDDRAPLEFGTVVLVRHPPHLGD